MSTPYPKEPISPLRARMIDDMRVRNFSLATQRGYIHGVKMLAAFLGRSPERAGIPAHEPAIHSLHAPPAARAAARTRLHSERRLRGLTARHDSKAGDEPITSEKREEAEAACRSSE